MRSSRNSNEPGDLSSRAANWASFAIAMARHTSAFSSRSSRDADTLARAWGDEDRPQLAVGVGYGTLLLIGVP
jgi:hypothetical protein